MTYLRDRMEPMDLRSSDDDQERDELDQCPVHGTDRVTCCSGCVGRPELLETVGRPTHDDNNRAMLLQWAISTGDAGKLLACADWTEREIGLAVLALGGVEPFRAFDGCDPLTWLVRMLAKGWKSEREIGTLEDADGRFGFAVHQPEYGTEGVR